MKGKEISILDEKDDEIVQLFVTLGMPKNLAKILVYLAQTDEQNSQMIEQGTALRQPEISIAIRDLRLKKWVEKRDEIRGKGKGSGRPIHFYRLAKSMSEIIGEFREEKLKEIETMKQNLELIEQRFSE